MTGPSKHYPDMALKKRRDAVCRLCPAIDADVCFKNRKAGVCPIDSGFDWIEDDISGEKAFVIPPEQKRLELED